MWVDEIFLCGDTDAVQEVKKAFNETFGMDDRGEISYFLGLRVTRNHNGIRVDQAKNIAETLLKFGMSSCKPVETPAVPNLNLTKEAQAYEGEFPYRSLIGNLLYIAKQTRPDILNTVNMLSRCLDKPTEAHVQVAKHLWRYLRGMSNLGLFYGNDNEMIVEGANNADFNSDRGDRKSKTGYYFKLKGSGRATSWEVRKQQTTALSAFF